MAIIGPNTGVDESFLHERMLLCVGEDSHELMNAVGVIAPAVQWDHWEYRSFQFWKSDTWGLVLCPIGTGCLEPLLWEMTRSKIVRRLVLFGTAGRFPSSKAVIGTAYQVESAHSAGTGINFIAEFEGPFRPNWPHDCSLPTASSVSTDFFYGFSPRILTGEYPPIAPRLRDAYAKYANTSQLIEMEVAQFYCLCGAFAGKDLHFCAVKCPANTVGALTEQSVNSQNAVQEALKASLVLIGAAGH